MVSCAFLGSVNVYDFFTAYPQTLLHFRPYHSKCFRGESVIGLAVLTIFKVSPFNHSASLQNQKNYATLLSVDVKTSIRFRPPFFALYIALSASLMNCIASIAFVWV